MPPRSLSGARGSTSARGGCPNRGPIARRVELDDRAHARRLGGVALGLGGAALIAAGAIKLAIHPGPRSRPRAASSGQRILEGLGLSRHGVVVLGRF